MGIPSFIRFWHEHNEQAIAVLVVLSLLVMIILLIRSIGDKVEAEKSAALDIGALEGTLRRVLDQGVAVKGGAPAGFAGAEAGDTASVAHAAAGGAAGAGAGSVSGGAADPEQVVKMTSALTEKDKAIASLQVELEKAKSELVQKSQGAGGGGDALQALEMQNRIRELEARLAEYEIIEDDIADLSMYKEENAKLKEELEALRASGGGAPSVVVTPPVTPLPFEPADKFELSAEDDVMKQFAAAVNDDKVPPKIEVEKEIVPTPATAPAASSLPDPALDALAAASAIAEGLDGAGASPQSAIDAMFAQAQKGGAPAPAAPDSQAAIDAMFADAQNTQSAAPAAAEPPPAAKDPAPAEGEDPLAGMVDTSKMIAEVENLGAAAPEDDGDALAETLDTDKLLMEVDALKVEGEPSASDDLLGEFNDVAKGG